MVTKSNGLPAESFGNDKKALADEIIIRTGFSRPAGLGCGLTAAEHTNAGAGIYTVNLAPSGCTWKAGQYNYAVQINSVVPSVGRYRGSALGSFEIPDEIPEAPVVPAP